MEQFIQTVRGPIAPQTLGQTLMHEHLAWDHAVGAGFDPPSITRWAIPRILDCIAQAQAVGVNAIVDVTPQGGAPSPLLIAEIAQRTDVHIVYALGLYTQEVHPYPRWVYPPAGTIETIAEHMVMIAKEGLHGSGVKPGLLKVATSGRAISVIEERVLRAAALAQQETGLLITTHTQESRFAEEQVDILGDAGADLRRVVIGHMGWANGPEDLPLFRRLVEQGVTLGFDMVGMPVQCSVEDVADIGRELITAGFGDRIVFSHDRCAHGRGASSWIYSPGWYSGDYTTVHRELVPALLARGISNDQVERILVANPRRLLTIDLGRYPRAADTVLWSPDPQDAEVLGDYGVVTGLSASA